MNFTQRLNLFQSHFRKNGWAVWDLADATTVKGVADSILQKLREVSGSNPVTLESYHANQASNDEHFALQYEMTKFFRESKFAKRILSEELDFFRALLGPDLLVQQNPYLRVTRPNQSSDNIGYHRDTFYGGSPYELSCVIPFVNLPSTASLGFVSGSHSHSEELYPTEQIQGDSEKGSKKHQMGFLYAPKVIQSDLEEQIVQVPLKVGQLLIFSLATVHGSTRNTSDISRWSTDVRVMNRFHPVDLSARPDYYETLETSMMDWAANMYFSNQKSPEPPSP